MEDVGATLSRAPPGSGEPGPLVYLVAGEASGDVLGAKLMAALRRRNGSVRFAGVGGERMIEAGLSSLFPVADIAVNGVIEVLPSLRRVFRRITETVADIARRRPAVVVTIDAPGFCLRVAKRVRPLGIPVIHYVAPQVWAWRPGRARELGAHIDHLLTLLPDEAELFTRHGLASTYVGHPAIEDRMLPADAGAFRARHGIAADRTVIMMVPGSRTPILRRMLPIFASALEELAQRRRDIFVVAAAVAATEDAMRTAAGTWKFPAVVVRDARDKRDAMAAATAAITLPGTVSLEFAVANLPMVVGSRVSLLTAIIAWLLVRVKYYSFPNVVLNRPAVPELLQYAATPSRLAARLERLVDDPGEKLAQRQAFADLCKILWPAEDSDGVAPSDRAAAVILDRVAAAERSALAAG